ncbi:MULTISPECIES: Rho termination factor N-terminal domain-containing protein [unclassified Modestobacter]|uniref:Rho termination factor N-terminal domain-containing protein n=1 Tax=unclassified Modestobacter TaxID=2643866 RepID=UPI0022AB2870|nr:MULTISPECIES: Rho termination factor N-terminal domain-containing protein [unclassified Modestobacter]MCZ2824313.1 Rho termination factor N-terminal domain-containing protein [Modestobacter sp. VKM Ac-2981]MCZ2854159.1 Rho termination factor N-terminal domain-containing protein [Modestobacter sp. VKM Ac-2982]
MTNETPNTPDLSETELRATKLDDLREQARAAGIGGTSSMKKEELVSAISDAHRKGKAAGGGAPEDGQAGQPGDRGPDDGHLRLGDETSRSLQYSQEITSLDEDPERAGRSLATSSHEVIRKWAEDRGGVPATVDGTEHGDHLGVLRFDFTGDSENLRQVSWDEWFDTFDARKLNFLYQEERKDGNQSNFFRLESPDREDA